MHTMSGSLRRLLARPLARRHLLRLLLAGSMGALWPRVSRAAAYRVGVGKSNDPYTAAWRALIASGEWPGAALAGRTVIIKPNLVMKRTPQTGIVTDPQVVRAVVDLALTAGAARVLIVEGAQGGGNFAACGYSFFADYGPSGRVALVNLDEQPNLLVDVPDGLAYRQLYLPALLRDEGTFRISIGKLKTHMESLVSLSMKNLFGLPPQMLYMNSSLLARFAMHDRGLHQTILDLNLVWPIDYALVDGVWGLEGNGPLQGTPVRMDLVVAGRNALAVDRVCLQIMGIAQDAVQHLTYAAQRGLGPADLTAITVAGDPLTPRPFVLPIVPPTIDAVQARPASFAPAMGQTTEISYTVDRACQTLVEIARASETSPQITRVRLLRDWDDQPAGPRTLSWDGRDDAGQIVLAGEYAINVHATGGETANNHGHATGWVRVRRGTVHLPLMSR